MICFPPWTLFEIVDMLIKILGVKIIYADEDRVDIKW